MAPGAAGQKRFLGLKVVTQPFILIGAQRFRSAARSNRNFHNFTIALRKIDDRWIFDAKLSRPRPMVNQRASHSTAALFIVLSSALLSLTLFTILFLSKMSKAAVNRRIVPTLRVRSQLSGCTKGEA